MLKKTNNEPNTLSADDDLLDSADQERLQQNLREWRDEIIDFIFQEATRLQIEDPESEKCIKFCELYELVKDEKNKPVINKAVWNNIDGLIPLVKEHRITVYNAQNFSQFLMGLYNFFQPPETMKNFRAVEKKEAERDKKQLQQLGSTNAPK